MSVLSTQTIRQLVEGGMLDISPFVEQELSHGMTYGLGPCGYDFRIHLPDNQKFITIAPGTKGFRLAVTKERFRFSPSVMGKVHDKSSWARQGIALQNTVLEPGWEGYITLEISNNGENHIKIPDGAPIGQVVFHTLDQPTEKPYKGKYQNQPQRPVEAIFETKVR